MDAHVTENDSATASTHADVFAPSGSATHVPPPAAHASSQLWPSAPYCQMAPVAPQAVVHNDAPVAPQAVVRNDAPLTPQEDKKRFDLFGFDFGNLDLDTSQSPYKGLGRSEGPPKGPTMNDLKTRTPP